jgi:hypothetical protein
MSRFAVFLSRALRVFTVVIIEITVAIKSSPQTVHSIDLLNAEILFADQMYGTTQPSATNEIPKKTDGP